MPLDRTHAYSNGPARQRPGHFISMAWFLSQGFFSRARTSYLICEAWRQFERCADVHPKVQLGPNAWCVNPLGTREDIVLGPGVVCRGVLRCESFGHGKIHIDADTYIGDDCLLSASLGIEIGTGTLLAHGVQILDNDSHPLNWRDRVEDWRAIQSGHGMRGRIGMARVRIGRYVWIGLHSIILKGVTIGDRSIIGAGSIVTKDIPSDVIAVGNPAQIVGPNEK